MEFILSSVHFEKAAKIKVVVGVFNASQFYQKKKRFCELPVTALWCPQGLVPWPPRTPESKNAWVSFTKWNDVCIKQCMSSHIFKITSFLPLTPPCLGQTQWNELTMDWNLWNCESDISSLFFKILMPCVLSQWWKPGWHSMGEKHLKNNFELWLVEFAGVEPYRYTLTTHSYLWTVLNLFQWKWEEGKIIRHQISSWNWGRNWGKGQLQI